jgi:hypothetical protein
VRLVSLRSLSSLRQRSSSYRARHVAHAGAAQRATEQRVAIERHPAAVERERHQRVELALGEVEVERVDRVLGDAHVPGQELEAPGAGDRAHRRDTRAGVAVADRPDVTAVPVRVVAEPLERRDELDSVSRRSHEPPPGSTGRSVAVPGG